jgi:glycosyltransferase involved in cell wall biosynthesis
LQGGGALSVQTSAPGPAWRREYDWIPDRAGRTAPEALAGRAGVLSACLVVRNEEATLQRCLESLRGVVDECVVVHDGPCADRTLDMAREFGCRVVEAPFHGHSERHAPLAYATAAGDWILAIDADEFLSPELAGALRTLVADPDVDGYELLWPHWDGERYLTSEGPYKLALLRRRATRAIGVIHVPEEIDGRVRRVALRLEHRPPAGHRTLRATLDRLARRGRLQAREYLTGLEAVPRFNYPGALRWSARREWTNRWSPVLVIPAALHTFWVVWTNLGRELGVRESVRFATHEAVYRGMVTALVAWFRYGPRGRSRQAG